MKKKKKLSAVLKSKKFFILLKNHSLYPKYEAKLKSLGAVISPFLDKEVNYVLTDTPGCNGKVALTAETLNILSPCYSVSPATSVSGDDCCATKKTRTRAEAMLERIPVQTQTASLNPIADAVSWNIPVYSIEFFQKWLDKKLSQIHVINEKNHSKNETNAARTFEKKYLKLESVLVNQYRPEFKEVSKWPSVDINTLAGSCPFDTKLFKKSGKKENENKKKEDERMNRACNKTANEAGYCEICAVHYSDLSQHVASSSHLKFTCNDKNYADIDNCIKTRSVEAFLAAHNSGGSNSQPKETNSNEPMGRNLRKAVSLHLNNNENSTAVTRSLTNNAKLLADESLKQPLQVQCNGFANYHLRKTSTKSEGVIIKSPNFYGSKDLLRESRKPYASCPDGGTVPANKEPHAQLSPSTKEENVHRLRSRKSLFLPSILLGTTAEDGPNKVRSGISPQTQTSNHFLRSSASPKSYPTRSKLPGTANVTDDDGRKRSAGSPGSLKCTDQTANASSIYFTRSKLGGGSPNDGESKRPSRGSVSPRDDNRGAGTNGRKRKLSAATSEDEEAGSASASPRNQLSYQSSRKTIKNNASCNDAAQLNSQKKRLSVEEKFLEDNREYYKVEMLRTKLRSTEFYCNQEINQTVPDTLKDTDSRFEPEQGVCDGEGAGAAVLDDDAVEQTENGDQVVMRFKKIKQRKSALSLLNLEAENFLFGPPKKVDSDDDSDSSHEQNGDDAGGDEISANDVDKRINDDGKKAKHPATNSTTSAVRRTKAKKRRTHAEVFIHDNLDYYRFEISGSRLRHQNADGTESTTPIVKKEPNDKTDDSSLTPSCSTTPAASAIRTVKVKEETVTDEENDNKLPPKKRGKSRRKDTTEMDNESETKTQPVPEPEATATSENSAENDAASSSCCVRTMPTESLHFSFESVPSKEPWFKTFARYDSCDEFYIPVPNTISRFQKIIANSRNTTARNSAAVAAAAAAANELNLSPLQRRKRRSKLARIIAEGKPRKSPRCHASTLAILSSLTNHRRRSRKIHAIETRRSHVEGRSPSARHDTEAASSGAVAKTAAAATSSTLELETRLKEAVTMLAKDADEHFIDLFSTEDCRDKYLNMVKRNRKDQKIETDKPPAAIEPAVANVESSTHCCMQLDESIFQDQDFLSCYVDGTSDAIVDNMATFMNDAQRCCNSMETALDEESVIPRSNDVLSRLCRENDNSCNSSDCGASSTCEFLGFAEDGRTVSRKRKRKRPNMTGWPHSNRRRRHIRFADIVQRDTNESPSRHSAAGSADGGTDNDNENNSEADSECTDDDMPLSQIVSKKRRRAASVSSAEASASSPAPAPAEQSQDTTSPRVVGRPRRSSKTPGRSSSLPFKRRGKRGRRRL